MPKPKNQSQSQFQQEISQQEIEIQDQIYQKPKKQMKYEKGSNNGKWSDEEKVMYFIFFDFIINKNCLVKGKKMNMIFKMMSQYLGTRNLLQCRSHHQKMCEKYGGLSTIVRNTRKQVDSNLYSSIKDQTDQRIEEIFLKHKEKLVNKNKGKKALQKSSSSQRKEEKTSGDIKGAQPLRSFEPTQNTNHPNKANIIQINTQQKKAQDIWQVRNISTPYQHSQFPYVWAYFNMGCIPWSYST